MKLFSLGSLNIRIVFLNCFKMTMGIFEEILSHLLNQIKIKS
jgi:DNA-directed RNA polymerase alpha subunit